MSGQGTRISVLIPAFNEVERVGGAVRAALAFPGVCEVLVIDDGSSDGTAEEAERSGATRVLRHSRNQGKGAALNTGWRASTGDVLLLVDADLGSSAAQAIRLLPPVLAREADLTIADFTDRRRTGLGFALRLARWGVRALTGRAIHSPLSGQRALRRELADALGGFAPRYGVETAMTVDALRQGFRVLEVPVTMAHRATGRDWSGFVHRGRQMRDIGLVLFRRALFRPRRCVQRPQE